jgi:hypothetical protein
MIGYIITTAQYNDIQGQFYTEYQFFHCVKDINEIWYLILSEEDKPEVAASQYAWVLNLPTGEYIPPPRPPFPPIT